MASEPKLDLATGRLFPLGIKADQVYRHLKEFATRAGVLCTVHALRKSLCSQLAAEGIPLQIAQRLMGHASPTTTQKYYTNLEDVLHDAVARL